jgi:hypothetical protein
MFSSAFSVCSFIVFGDLFDPLLAVALVVSSVVGVVAFDAVNSSEIKFSVFFDLSALGTRTVGSCHCFYL